MRLNKNNKGFSLVEMLVAVAILSIVMAAIAWILSTMSKSFGNSQKEVQLQDSVQATYSIISDLIKESQTIETGGTTPPSVVFDSAKQRAYIIDEEKGGAAPSGTYYIVELNQRKLYLTTGALYASGSSTMVDYEAVASTDVVKDANLLAANVEEFTIDTSKLADGYVVLAISLKYGTREASIAQNVYVRNSNTSAEWVKSASESTDPSEDLDGYKLISIDSVTCEKTQYSLGATAKKSDFVIKGTYENESDPTDTKQVQIAESDFESAQIGVPLNTMGSNTFAFTFKNSDLTASCDVMVSAGSAGLSLQNENITAPTMNQINTSNEINVYYTANKATGTASFTSLVPASDVCPLCGGSVREEAAEGDWDTSGYKCNADGSNPGCQNQYNKFSTPNHIDEHYETKAYKTGSGQFTIINESEINDYSNVKVRLYIERADTGFTKPTGAVGFLTLDVDDTTGTQSVTYDITGTVSSGYTEYIEITIPNMPKGSEEDGFTSYTFNFAWASADASMTSDEVVAMAVYSVDAD